MLARCATRFLGQNDFSAGAVKPLFIGLDPIAASPTSELVACYEAIDCATVKNERSAHKPPCLKALGVHHIL